MRNPFPVYADGSYGLEVERVGCEKPIKGWKWRDETGAECERIYQSQEGALHDLIGYIRFLNHGPTLWQRVWWPIRYSLWPLLKRFWTDTSSGAAS